MKTVLTKSAVQAAEIIKAGGIAAFPTETVYGLGANIFDAAAVGKIFAAKGRPADNPLIAHIAEIDDISLVVKELTAFAEKLAEAFFPAPLTLVLPKNERVPLIATANLDTIGVRQPRHEIALDLIKACGFPLAAPSANLSGNPSPTDWQSVYADLQGKIEAILQGDVTEIGLESTVVDCTGEHPQVLRRGAITLEELRRVVPQTIYAPPDSAAEKRSPGLKYRHYAPQAKVVLIESEDEIENAENCAYIGLKKINAPFIETKICASVEEYAHELFRFFRRADDKAAEKIYCQKVSEKGLGAALTDRLQRAASANN